MGRIQLAFELKNMGVYVSWLTLNTCHNRLHRLQKEHIIWAVPSTFPEISGSRTLLWPLQLNNIARDPVSQQEKSTKFAQLMEAILRTYPETTRSSPIRSNQIQSGSIIEVPGPTLLFSLSKAVHRESPWWTMFGWQLGGFCCQLSRFKGAVKWQLHCRCTVCLFWQFRHFMSNFDAACHLWLTFRRYR